ncbi:MAG TPA: phosphopantetheine-binding protein [Planctomycetaceae bacterium]|jgi:acyl carrier protein
MSLDMMDFIMQVEKTYGFEIPDEDYESLKTIGLLCEYIRERSPQSDSDEILQAVRKMISEHTFIPIVEIKSESRWVEDLGFG